MATMKSAAMASVYDTAMSTLDSALEVLETTFHALDVTKIASDEMAVAAACDATRLSVATVLEYIRALDGFLYATEIYHDDGEGDT
jgi:hypothetical protein